VSLVSKLLDSLDLLERLAAGERDPIEQRIALHLIDDLTGTDHTTTERIMRVWIVTAATVVRAPLREDGHPYASTVHD
jgi:hypothetical protein